jgi:ribA/ribD-fused uncharacterized protein
MCAAPTSVLKQRPAGLALTWAPDELIAFPAFEVAARLWREWLARESPTDEQVYRKLLVDVLIDYMRANAFGAEFDTVHAKYEEFNRCTGSPVRSTSDYVGRVRPLLDYMLDHQTSSAREQGEAIFQFIVNGMPTGGVPGTEDVSERVLFYRVGEPYGFLSNFAPFPVEVDGKTWPTTEHYFQAQKFAGRVEEEQVRKAPSASEAARLGRKLAGLRPDWDAVKDEVMLKAVRAKFTQHPDLRRQLLETGDRKLVEHTSNDSYWADGGDGSGRNRLGELLMRVRAELGSAL